MTESQELILVRAQRIRLGMETDFLRTQMALKQAMEDENRAFLEVEKEVGAKLDRMTLKEAPGEANLPASG
jgi:hypothetical protein